MAPVSRSGVVDFPDSDGMGSASLCQDGVFRMEDLEGWDAVCALLALGATDNGPFLVDNTRTLLRQSLRGAVRRSRYASLAKPFLKSFQSMRLSLRASTR